MVWQVHARDEEHAPSETRVSCFKNAHDKYRVSCFTHAHEETPRLITSWVRGYVCRATDSVWQVHAWDAEHAPSEARLNSGTYHLGCFTNAHEEVFVKQLTRNRL